MMNHQDEGQENLGKILENSILDKDSLINPQIIRKKISRAKKDSEVCVTQKSERLRFMEKMTTKSSKNRKFSK